MEILDSRHSICDACGGPLDIGHSNGQRYYVCPRCSIVGAVQKDGENTMTVNDEKCSDCEGQVTVTTEGERVCTKCGLVQGGAAEQAYMRSFRDPGQYSLGKRNHIVNGLGSEIGYYQTGVFSDSQGRVLPRDKQIAFRRLKFQQDVRADPRKAPEYAALRVLNITVGVLGLPLPVRNKAAYYYGKLKKLEPIRFRKLTIIACLWMAIKDSRGYAPVTLKELASKFAHNQSQGVTAKAIARRVWEIHSKLGLNLPARRSEDYIGRAVSDVIANIDVQRRLSDRGMDQAQYAFQLSSGARAILASVTRRGGMKPLTLTAAAIYAADRQIQGDGDKPILTGALLAKATGTLEYSLRHHFCRLFKKQLNRSRVQHGNMEPSEAKERALS